MSQPPKSTMRAPAATWVSASGVRFREADMDRLRCGGIARVTEYAGLARGARIRLDFRPSFLLPESCPARDPRVCTFGAWATHDLAGAPGLSRVLFQPDGRLAMADAARHGLPERFRADCAFGGGSGDHGRSLPRLA